MGTHDVHRNGQYLQRRATAPSINFRDEKDSLAPSPSLKMKRRHSFADIRATNTRVTAMMALPNCDNFVDWHFTGAQSLRMDKTRSLRTLGRRASLVVFEAIPAQPFWPAAACSLVLGVFSVVPYNMVLASDPGSPLFISFITHLFFVAINLHKAPRLIMHRKIPWRYHAGFVVLGFLFNLLKSDATSRLPTAVAMVLLNLQMLVGVVVQRLAFGTRYTLSQLSGVAAVMVGVGLAGLAARAQSTSSGGMETSQFLIGTAEMIGALLALTVLSILVKTAFEHHGENVDEQIFYQHLFSLPLFFIGTQWSHIGPRIHDWAQRGDWWMMALVLANNALTFGDRVASVQMAGRAPNFLLVQLIETLKKFTALLLTALLNSPPFPPVMFWGGALTLAFGTVQFLSASDSTPADSDTESPSESGLSDEEDIDNEKENLMKEVFTKSSNERRSTAPATLGAEARKEL